VYDGRIPPRRAHPGISHAAGRIDTEATDLYTITKMGGPRKPGMESVHSSTGAVGGYPRPRQRPQHHSTPTYHESSRRCLERVVPTRLKKGMPRAYHAATTGGVNGLGVQFER